MCTLRKVRTISRRLKTYLLSFGFINIIYIYLFLVMRCMLCMNLYAIIYLLRGCDVFHDVTYMMVIYDCSLKEAHQYKIALRQPAMWVLYLYIHMSFCVCVYVCVCVCVCMCVCVCECVCVCAGERERQYMRKTMAQRRKHASFSASSATKRGLTNIARPSSTKTARPHKEPL